MLHDMSLEGLYLKVVRYLLSLCTCHSLCSTHGGKTCFQADLDIYMYVRGGHLICYIGVCKCNLHVLNEMSALYKYNSNSV